MEGTLVRCENSTDLQLSCAEDDIVERPLVRCDDATLLEAQCAEHSSACFDQCCRSCERGMSCDHEATNNLTAVPIEANWWRATLWSDTLYECEYAGACKNGACTEGHEGTACRVCSDGHYFDSMQNRCESCGGGTNLCFNQPSLTRVEGT